VHPEDATGYRFSRWIGSCGSHRVRRVEVYRRSLA
jgi:hypothetical protein